MKKILLVIFLTPFYAAFSFAAAAGDASQNPGLIPLGMLASFGVHEAGHHLVGTVSGKIRWREGLWVYYGNENELKLVAISGFRFQSVGSELLLETMPTDNLFLVGYIGFNIINNILYVAKMESTKYQKEGGNDFLVFKNKNHRRIVEIAVLARAISLAYRLFNANAFRGWIDVDLDEGVPTLKLLFSF
ncbi:MAG: hypothetical protein HYS44_02175 [Candidatus Niyogibacteria bacterium]|nr:hypothetical protein [Candidatus Niyogibacteria bacterium]